MEKFQNTKTSVSQLPVALTQYGTRVNDFHIFGGIICSHDRRKEKEGMTSG